MFSVGWTCQGFCRDLDPCWSEYSNGLSPRCDPLIFVPLCDLERDWHLIGLMSDLLCHRSFFNVTILPVVTKDLPISPRFTPYELFIAMQVQHSYNSSTNG